jgi:hypothetical protein
MPISGIVDNHNAVTYLVQLLQRQTLWRPPTSQELLTRAFAVIDIHIYIAPPLERTQFLGHSKGSIRLLLDLF